MTRNTSDNLFYQLASSVTRILFYRWHQLADPVHIFFYLSALCIFNEPVISTSPGVESVPDTGRNIGLINRYGFIKKAVIHPGEIIANQRARRSRLFIPRVGAQPR